MADDQSKVNKYSLEELVGALQSSIISANKAVQHQYAYILESSFNYDKDEDVYTPKFVKLQTAPNDKELKVPIIALMNPSTLCTKEMKLSFSLMLNEVEMQDLVNIQGENQVAPNNKTSLTVSLSPQGKVLNEQRFPNEVEIEIQLESQPCSEGISRIIDRYLSGIVLG